MNNQDLTLLSEGQIWGNHIWGNHIWGNHKESQLEVIRKYGTKAAITDLCVLTGSYLCVDTDYNIDEDSSLTAELVGFGLDLIIKKMMSAWSMRMVIGTAVLDAYALVLFAQLCNLL